MGRGFRRPCCPADVKVLVEQSANEVTGGTKLVADAASRLVEMLTAVRENSALMEGIVRESRTQASSIEQVSVAVREMDKMTQHNAGLVEETNAAMVQTEAQASELDHIVEAFQLDPNTVSRKAQPTASKPFRNAA
jgi:methyl-accepting chemotaxis protein